MIFPAYGDKLNICHILILQSAISDEEEKISIWKCLSSHVLNAIKKYKSRSTLNIKLGENTNEIQEP